MHSKVWTDMFVLALPMAEKILRPVAVYLFLVIGLRLAGKLELAQLNRFDLVVLLTLSNTVQNAIIGDDISITGGIIGASILLLVNYLVVRFLYRREKLGRLVEGESCALIENGQVLEHKLTQEVLTRMELEAAAHKQGFGNLCEVESAVLEPSGTISFIAKIPVPEETRHQEVLRRLDQLTREVSQLRLRERRQSHEGFLSRRPSVRHRRFKQMPVAHAERVLHPPNAANRRRTSSVQQQSGCGDAKPREPRYNSQEPENALTRQQRQ